LLPHALVAVPGIQRAWIFGSHADRTERPDSDLDVMIVGTPDQAALSQALMPVEDTLGRAIHTTTMSAAEFQSRRDRPGFVSEVMAGPRILLVGEDG